MNIDVLFVDDFLDAAEEYSNLIRNKTKLKTAATDSPEKALEIVKTNNVKVVVLDQRMPQKDGTELFEELKLIDPAIRAIMVTGEADGDEVGNAMTIGFCDYVHKSKILELPHRVLLHYCSYHNISEHHNHKSDEKILLYEHKKGFFQQSHKTTYHLLSIDLIDENYIFPTDWKTILNLNSGEKKRYTDKYEINDKLHFEDEIQAKLTGSLNASSKMVTEMKAKLESTISNKIKNYYTSEEKKMVQIEKEYSLPEEPTNIESIYVKSRHYQKAAVYRKIVAYIEKSCDLCQSEILLPIILYQTTNRIATRQKDILNNGHQKVVETGIEAY